MLEVGDYVLRYRVIIPRAMKLKTELQCSEIQKEGTIGESYQDYKARRLSEIERENRQRANLIGSIVGAAVPDVIVHAESNTNHGRSVVHGEVDSGNVASSAITASSPSPQLHPNDTGAREMEHKTQITLNRADSCEFSLVSAEGENLAGVRLSLVLEKQVNVKAEQRAIKDKQRRMTTEVAIHARNDMLKALVDGGAESDPVLASPKEK